MKLPDKNLIFILAVTGAALALRLPRLAVLSELVEGVARELMEVHVGGTLQAPQFRADIVRSVRKALEAISAARQPPGTRPFPATGRNG